MTWTKTLNKDRASGVIIKNNKVLLIHRIRDNKEYWVIPGGGIEKGESIEQALNREIREELEIRIKEKEFILKLKNAGRIEYYFFITNYEGVPKIGGPELKRMNENNQYILEEREVTKISEINLLPNGLANKLQEFLSHR